MQYSKRAIFNAYIRTLAERSENDFEKFLIQQNLIQYLLISLIIFCAKRVDRKLLDWIEERTIGNLIPLFKICEAGDKKDLLLIESLEVYNKKRKELVHKILEINNYDKIKAEVIAANKIGVQIINQLDQRFIKELENRIGKPLSEYKKQKRTGQTVPKS